MSTVLRRLYNVAYGRVRLWQEGASDPTETDEPVPPVRGAASVPDDTPDPDPVPAPDPEPRTVPATPRQRRL